jgi:steroid delta-isomerase-like uncharacterized protein
MEDLKESLRRWIDAYNARNLNELTEAYAEDAELSGPTAGQVKGRQPIADHWKMALETTPDAKATIDRMISEGNVVVVEYTVTGTNTGPLRLPTGEVLPATNKRVTVPGLDILTYEGGKIVSHHLYFDRVPVLAQLGLIPAPASART